MDCAVTLFTSTDAALKKISADPTVTKIDLFEHCLEELFEVEHPWLKSGDPIYAETYRRYHQDWEKRGALHEQGIWAYYPWSKTLVHLPEKSVFRKLRTCRNRNLVTEAEQEQLLQKNIGIAGMSVGSNILNVMAMSGVGGTYRIADFDEISVPNLNRLMAPLTAVTMHKGVYYGRRTLELDPFTDVKVFEEGLREQDFEEFFLEPKLDLFVEEVDTPTIKLSSRIFARKHGIPVIMAADNGDGVFVDVERFDLEPDLMPFHGRASQKLLDTIREGMTFSERLVMIAEIAGLSEATPRMQDSIQEVGTFLNTWPQLGTAAVTAGTAMTFVAKRILLGLPMPTGRYYVAQEDAFIANHNSPSQVEARNSHTKTTMTAFNNFQRFLEDVGKL